MEKPLETRKGCRKINCFFYLVTQKHKRGKKKRRQTAIKTTIRLGCVKMKEIPSKVSSYPSSKIIMD